MAVLLDDGRAVAFDTKDYAAVDHGYAATIHKTQGVTVDRTYVLASPGLDRHAAYVALSRHRESVSLHYGQDDFADQGKLVRTLGRDRAKDMAADYVAGEAPDLSAAVARHGRIVRAMRFSKSIEQPFTAEQRAELKASRAALEQIRPQATSDLETAFANEPGLITQAANGRTQAAVRAM
jgi:RNA helicase